MRIGQTIWYSARISPKNAEIDEYSTPIPIKLQFNYFSVMPATSRGYMEVMKYGEDVDSTWTAIANMNAFSDKQGFVVDESLLDKTDVLSTKPIFKHFQVGDRFWLDGEKPIPELEDEYGIGSTATAVVKSVAYINHTISITLTRNKEQVSQ